MIRIIFMLFNFETRITNKKEYAYRLLSQGTLAADKSKHMIPLIPCFLAFGTMKVLQS